MNMKMTLPHMFYMGFTVEPCGSLIHLLHKCCVFYLFTILTLSVPSPDLQSFISYPFITFTDLTAIEEKEARLFERLTLSVKYYIKMFILV